MLMFSLALPNNVPYLSLIEPFLCHYHHKRSVNPILNLSKGGVKGFGGAGRLQRVGLVFELGLGFSPKKA